MNCIGRLKRQGLTWLNKSGHEFTRVGWMDKKPWVDDKCHLMNSLEWGEWIKNHEWMTSVILVPSVLEEEWTMHIGNKYHS